MMVVSTSMDDTLEVRLEKEENFEIFSKMS